MKIIEIKELFFEKVKVIKFARFCDERGFFTEHFRKSDILKLPFLKDFHFVQLNESFSRKNTIRGLHFQWNPYQGKLVRTIFGRMVDIVMDIRKGSPHFGKILAYDMPANNRRDYDEWIWVPPGFAHGNFYTEESRIEYFCTGEYNPLNEAGISPLASDIDWSFCDEQLKKEFIRIVQESPLISEKDKKGLTVSDWLNDKRSDNFVFGKL